MVFWDSKVACISLSVFREDETEDKVLEEKISNKPHIFSTNNNNNNTDNNDNNSSTTNKANNNPTSENVCTCMYTLKTLPCSSSQNNCV